MADVFLSYAREDRPRAKALADALASKDWSVWWDREILVGQDFSHEIDKELAAAHCVIVLWSTHAVNSHWVRTEATEGMRRGVLVPIVIDTSATIPIEFRLLHTANLSAWPREAADFEDCLAAIAALVKLSKSSAPTGPSPAAEQPEPHRLREDTAKIPKSQPPSRRVALGLLALGGIAVVFAGVQMILVEPPPVPPPSIAFVGVDDTGEELKFRITNPAARPLVLESLEIDPDKAVKKRFEFGRLLFGSVSTRVEESVFKTGIDRLTFHPSESAVSSTVKVVARLKDERTHEEFPAECEVKLADLDLFIHKRRSTTNMENR